MKKLISIYFLLFLAFSLNAQMKSKSKYSELNQEQLNLVLQKSQNTVTTGKLVTLIGLGATTIGTTLIIRAATKSIIDGSDNSNSALSGSYLMIIGSCTTLIGIPVWVIGASRRNQIELELVKFSPKGSASINGIGLKIRF